jgi:hypothetical protein
LVLANLIYDLIGRFTIKQISKLFGDWQSVLLINLVKLHMGKKIDLELTSAEKGLLKEKKITQKALADLAIDEVIDVLHAKADRAKILQALFEFQSIPSLGIEFARDMMFMGYYKVSDIKDKTGPELINQYERKLGYRVDPCVEDQFWLVVENANNPDSKKVWWDYTQLRKDYRIKNGYPADRP